jgi:hypothetical protein
VCVCVCVCVCVKRNKNGKGMLFHTVMFHFMQIWEIMSLKKTHIKL